MDYKNNPRNDRSRFLVFLEQFVRNFYQSDESHKEEVYLVLPEIELSPDSMDLYESYSTFLGANRRKILDDFRKIQWPIGTVVQLEIHSEARVHISYLN